MEITFLQFYLLGGVISVGSLLIAIYKSDEREIKELEDILNMSYSPALMLMIGLTFMFITSWFFPIRTVVETIQDKIKGKGED